MKTRSAILGLAAVGVLLGWALLRVDPAPAEREAATGPARSPPGPGRSVEPAGSEPHREGVGGDDRPPFTWRSVESRDLKQYLANLRALGCPEQTVQDLMLAKVNGLFAEREEAFRFRPADAAKPWASQANLTAEDLERQDRWRAVQLEKRALLRELGLDMPLDVLRSTHARNYDDVQAALAGVPAAKRDQVQSLKEAYWRASDDLKRTHAQGPREEYVEAYRRLNDEHRAELARVLTPRELEDFEMRTSVTGTNLAQSLAEFKPAESEFRAIFRATRDYEEATGRVGGQYGLGDAGDETRQTTRLETLDRVRAALGDERFAEFERCQDSSYRDLVRAAEHHELPREVALRAHAMVKAYDEERRRLDEDPDLTAAGRRQAATELEAVFEAARSEVLGPDAERTYRLLRAGFKDAAGWDP